MVYAECNYFLEELVQAFPKAKVILTDLEEEYGLGCSGSRAKAYRGVGIPARGSEYKTSQILL